MSLIFRAAAVSDRGKVRDNNEDAVHTGPRLIAVADGVGGGPSGEIASGIVIQELARLEEDGGGSLEGAIQQANRRIRAAVESDADLEGMGTTLTALHAVEDGLQLAHIGDSRAYVWRDGTLAQLSRDDTFVQGLVDEGIISAEDARAHPQRSLVTQAMHGAAIEPTFAPVGPRAGDRYLLCSDGLSDYVNDDVIAHTVGRYDDPEECARELVALALDAGGLDNVTVVVATAER